MTFEELCDKYEYGPFTTRPNKLDMPLNIIPNTEEGMNEFNEIVDCIHSLDLIGRTPMTKSGGISIKDWTWMGTYNIIPHGQSSIEIILLHDGYHFRFEFRRDFKNDKDGISGRAAFTQFSKICKEFDINIDDLRISTEDGLKTKETIPSPLIDVDESILNETLENVHHIDFHSAYMSGIAINYPQLREPVEYIFNKRKDPDKSALYKAILTHTYGYMQSQYSPIYYQFSHLSKSAMVWCRAYLEEITKRLILTGRKVIMHNTDGVWYQGEIYHGEGEGKGIGQWENDHINCKYRAKSKGIYEFIENDKYTVVARGRYELDKIKPREDWEWGDIYFTGKSISFTYDSITEHLYKEEE